MDLNIINITGFYVNDTLVVDDDVISNEIIPYSVAVYCCFQNTGCGNVFYNGTRSPSSHWKHVISTDSEIDLSTYEVI